MEEENKPLSVSIKEYLDKDVDLSKVVVEKKVEKKEVKRAPKVKTH
jgi:hypothetical protein